MAATLTTLQTQIIGTAIAEILSGEHSDETINAIDSLKCENLRLHSITWSHGYRT